MADAAGPIHVRRYRHADAAAVADRLYESSGGMYDRYAGNRKHAVRAIRRALERERTTASGEVVWVAEHGGRVAGAMAAMPFSEWKDRARTFLSVTLRAIPPWRWPTAIAVYRATARGAPTPPPSSLYVDSLATAPDLRRLGVARALLAEAERVARAQQLHHVALDTWVDNHAARALYAAAGFREVSVSHGVGQLPGGVSLLKEVPQ